MERVMALRRAKREGCYLDRAVRLIRGYADEEACSSARTAAVSAAVRERAGETSARGPERRCRHLAAGGGAAEASPRLGRRGRRSGVGARSRQAGALAEGQAGPSGSLDSWF